MNYIVIITFLASLVAAQNSSLPVQAQTPAPQGPAMSDPIIVIDDPVSSMAAPVSTGVPGASTPSGAPIQTATHQTPTQTPLVSNIASASLRPTPTNVLRDPVVGNSATSVDAKWAAMISAVLAPILFL